jgi:hypothetical protein
MGPGLRSLTRAYAARRKQSSALSFPPPRAVIVFERLGLPLGGPALLLLWLGVSAGKM